MGNGRRGMGKRGGGYVVIAVIAGDECPF